ncbi:5959_t:CDS:1, partial [Cetraspora pellucida]
MEKAQISSSDETLRPNKIIGRPEVQPNPNLIMIIHKKVLESNKA